MLFHTTCVLELDPHPAKVSLEQATIRELESEFQRLATLLLPVIERDPHSQLSNAFVV